MRRDEFGEMLQRIASGWASREYESVAGHFADRVFYSDALNYTFRDCGSLLEFFRDDGGKEQSCTFHNWVFDEERQLGVAEFSYAGSYIYYGTAWIEMAEDKIACWREYQHRSEKTFDEFWQK
jgi:hypothetical protein